MAKTDPEDWRTAWWTALAAVIPYTVINQLAAAAERSLNKNAHARMTGYFAYSQSDYFPLLFLAVLFFVIFAIVFVYSMIITRMPSNWAYRGILLGTFLFLVGVLPFTVQAGFTTNMPSSVAWGTLFFGLISNIVNGGLIAYIHMRITNPETKKKKDK